MSKDIEELARIIEHDRSYRTHRSTYFRDMIATHVIALRNQAEPVNQAWNQREEEYFRYLETYGKETFDVWQDVLGKIFLMGVKRMGDHLGALNMHLDLGEKHHGQFFTPYEVSRLMAAMAYGNDMRQAIEAHGYVSVNEPACGSGSMIIAMAQTVKEQGHDISDMRAICQDIDRHCVNMTYIQMRVYGIPAAVIHGDTLKLEEREVLLTPEYVLKEQRLQQK